MDSSNAPPRDAALAEFEAERDRLSQLTRKGIGMPAAGLIYWAAVALVLQQFPQKTALIISFFLTGMVFPVGVVITRLAGGNLFARSASLTPLGLLLAAIQLFYWPIIIMVFRQAPDWTPFAMGVLFGSHFLPYGWLYKSRGYSFLAVASVLALTAGVLVTRSPLYTTAPQITAACYAIAVGMLWREIR